MQHLVQAVTDFGDAALLIPVTLTILLCLLAGRAPRTALAWAAAISLCCAVMIGLKVTFLTCGHSLSGGSIASPSGHTAFAATVYGSLTVLLYWRVSVSWLRRFLVLLSGLWIAAIGISRVILHAHVPVEVVIGFAVGAICVTIFYKLAKSTERLPLVTTGLCLLIVLLTLHGTRARAEAYIAAIAHAMHHKVFTSCS